MTIGAGSPPYTRPRCAAALATPSSRPLSVLGTRAGRRNNERVTGRLGKIVRTANLPR